MAANIIDDQNGVSADAGVSDAATQRVIPATDSPTYGTEGTAAPTYIEQVGGKFETVPTAISDGQLGAILISAYKRIIGVSDNLALGSKQTTEIAPEVYDFMNGSVCRAAAALSGAGAFDAAPTEIPSGGAKKIRLTIYYDENAGATNGAVSVRLDLCTIESGADHWAPKAAEEQQAAALGAATVTWAEPEYIKFDPLTAANEGVSVTRPLDRAHKFRVAAAETGDAANPGQCEIIYELLNE